MDKLKEYFKTNRQIIYDRKRMKSMLLDFLPENKLMRNQLIMAIDLGIVENMSESENISSNDLYRFSKEIVDSYGILDDSAKNIIMMWASILSLKQVQVNWSELEAVNFTIQNNYSEDIPDDFKTKSGQDKRNDVIIDGCFYRLFDNGYHMMKVIDGRNKLILRDSINGINVTEVGTDYYDSDLGICGFNVCQKNLREVELPKYAKCIGGFKDCEFLEKINLPETVEEIQQDTFDGCIRLKKISLPSKLEYVGDGAFSLTYSLRQLIFPDNVKEIGSGCFMYCKALMIRLPKNMTKLEEGVLEALENINELIFPEKLLPGEIRKEAFMFDANNECDYDEEEIADKEEAFDTMMDSLQIVRVAKQNEEEARKFFLPYGVEVVVMD